MRFDPSKRQTWGQMFEEICTISSVEEGRRYILDYAEALAKRTGTTREEALLAARQNIGYLLGYGASKQACSTWAAARANHPIFGDPRRLGSVSSREALEKGIQLGREAAGHPAAKPE